jgi:hypothetical protein
VTSKKQTLIAVVTANMSCVSSQVQANNEVTVPFVPLQPAEESIVWNVNRL